MLPFHERYDITGQTFGRWHVIGKSTHKPRRYKATLWDCRCECGRMGTVAYISLKKGLSQSCGCLQREKVSASMKAYNARKRGNAALEREDR